jgi:hypothetical protein
VNSLLDFQIVEILDANDLAGALALSDLGGRHVAQSDMADQTLPLEIGDDAERLFERPVGRRVVPNHAALQHIDAEVVQIVVHGQRELLASHCRKNRAFGTACRTHFRAPGLEPSFPVPASPEPGFYEEVTTLPNAEV